MAVSCKTLTKNPLNSYGTDKLTVLVRVVEEKRGPALEQRQHTRGRQPGEQHKHTQTDGRKRDKGFK